MLYQKLSQSVIKRLTVNGQIFFSNFRVVMYLRNTGKYFFLWCKQSPECVPCAKEILIRINNIMWLNDASSFVEGFFCFTVRQRSKNFIGLRWTRESESNQSTSCKARPLRDPDQTHWRGAGIVVGSQG